MSSAMPAAPRPPRRAILDQHPVVFVWTVAVLGAGAIAHVIAELAS